MYINILKDNINIYIYLIYLVIILSDIILFYNSIQDASSGNN